ncbi:MAG: hypothetical protein Fur0022_45030 [Anaerolineales bacterium]
MMNDPHEELLQFFKTFVDIERLKLVGTLAQGPATLQELAERTGMTAPETLRHLGRLQNTGLTHAFQNQDGNEVFALQPQVLEEMAKRQFARARELNPPAPDQRQIPADFTEEERKVTINFTRPNGEVKQIPLQPKKQQILVRYVRHHVLAALTPGKQYPEKDINLLIKKLHPDAAFFRRTFVDTGYLDRHPNGSAYWLTAKAQEILEGQHD